MREAEPFWDNLRVGVRSSNARREGRYTRLDRKDQTKKRRDFRRYDSNCGDHGGFGEV
jgi:hypothetical protein